MNKMFLAITLILTSVAPTFAQPAIYATSTRSLVLIKSAAIQTNTIEKYTSRAGKIHILYQFSVDGKNYQAIVYAGKWNSATLNHLRSGKANLIGKWDKYQGKPSFVTERVE